MNTTIYSKNVWQKCLTVYVTPKLRSRVPRKQRRRWKLRGGVYTQRIKHPDTCVSRCVSLLPWMLAVRLETQAMQAPANSLEQNPMQIVEKTFRKTPLHCWTFQKKETAQRGACEILWGGLCQRFPPQIPSPKLPSSSPVHLVNTFCKKKRRGPDNYCLILFVGDRSIIYPVSLKMVRFPLRIAEQIKHTTIMNIRTYPYMMKPSCWVLQTVQDLKIWGIHWHRKRKKRPNTPWHLVLQICQGDSLGSAQLTKEDDESWRI